MKKYVTLVIVTIVLCSCTVNGVLDIPVNDSHIFKATIEHASSTRTYVDSDLFMYWNYDDTVSIFTTTLNEAYSFDGQTGDTGGTFTKVETGKFRTGQEISANYAVYPYDSYTNLNSDGTIRVRFPENQKFNYGSFAQGSNTMVAVTSSVDDYFLNFKNVCGYLVVRLFGTGNVKSVTVKANAEEQIAGVATLSASHDDVPTIQSYYYGAKDAITLDCDGVYLGASYNNPSPVTEFWFCIPPVTFSEGFTVVVTSTDGKWFSKSTDSAKTINRNVINYMAPLEVSFKDDIDYAVFEDPKLEELIVSEYDLDFDDRISSWEAYLVQSVNLYPHHYSYHGTGKVSSFFSSIKGLEFFTNLKEIRQCPIQTGSLDLTPFKSLEFFSLEPNKLTSVSSIDCSGLDKLKELFVIGYGQKNSDSGGYTSEGNLVSLTLEGCSSLKELECFFNKNLSEIDLSDCSELTDFSAYWCNISSIDLTNNPKLKTLYLTGNPISSIDLSHNPDLEWVAFLSTNMESVDISHNPKLKTFYTNNTSIVGDGASIEFYQVGINDPSVDHYTVPFKNLKEFNFWSPEGCDFDYLDISACVQLESFWTSWRHIKNIIFGPSAASLKTLHLDHMYGDLTLDFASFTSLEELDCSGGTFKTLDVSMVPTLKTLYCQDSPDLKEIWLKEGQVIDDFVHDDTLCIKYK